MLVPAQLSRAAHTAVPPVYKRDRTSDVPVTTFRRSTRLYNQAMSYNRRLDGDKDGIACEQA